MVMDTWALLYCSLGEGMMELARDLGVMCLDGGIRAIRSSEIRVDLTRSRAADAILSALRVHAVTNHFVLGPTSLHVASSDSLMPFTRVHRCLLSQANKKPFDWSSVHIERPDWTFGQNESNSSNLVREDAV